MSESKIPPEVKLYFPFPKVRAGQGLAINTIFKGLIEERDVVISAPNGFGKTITVLSAVIPLLKNNENKLKIVYLCRTHVQGQHVIKELNSIIKHLKQSNYMVKLGGISLRGRSSMCFHPQIVQYARDPANAQLLCSELRKLKRCSYDLNLNENPEQAGRVLSELESHAVDATELIEICRYQEFCPYQVSKYVLTRMDIIVGSYQWLFSPFIRDYFLESIGTTLNNVILILDEAHNVPEVARDISSDQLTYFAVEQMVREAEELDLESFADFGSNLLDILDDLKDKITEEVPISPKLTLKKVFSDIDVASYVEKMIKTGEIWRKKRVMEGKNPRSYLHSVGQFWKYWFEMQDNKSIFYCVSKFTTRTGYETVKLEVVSLDPRNILKPLLEKVYASVSLSGTIEPIHYYSDIIGLPETSLELSIPSPFPKENFLVLSMKNLNTKGSSRDSKMYKKYIARCVEAVKAIPKNVGIFTASYDVLNGLIKNGILDELKSTKKEIYFEQKGLTSNKNDQMIARYKRSASKKGAVLLGVCGGRNAEGEDFPGDLMNGVILCGVPFARPTARIKAIIDYYGGSKKGKDYAYNMPAFRRANQAAGRPIRTLKDKGTIILLDFRYNLPFYKIFLSSWLKSQIVSLPDEPGKLKEIIEVFWA